MADAQSLADKLAAARQRLRERSESAAEPARIAQEPSQSAPAVLTAEKPTLKRKSKQLAQHVDKAPEQRNVPYSPEAEEGVLGSIFVDCRFNKSTAAIEHAASRLNPFNFFVPAHKVMFELMLSLFKENKPIEAISFSELLREKNLLDSIGGSAKIMHLTGLVPTADFVAHYCDIVLEHARRREIISLGARMMHAGHSAHTENSLELLKSFEGSITRLLEASTDTGFVDATNLLNGELPPLPRLIVRRLLHEGDKMIIGGGSKARKTWGLIDFALAVSTGTDWWEFNTYKSRVCYVNLELPAAWFARRLKALCEAKGLTLDEGQLKILNLRGRVVTVETLRKHVTPLLKANKSQLCIMDPVYKLLGDRDENSAGDIAALLNEIEKISVDTGAAIAFAAHYSKGNQALKEFIDRIGGSGVFARDPDVVMTMTQHEESDCFSVETRCRNVMSPRPFVVRWEYPQFMRDDEKNPDLLKGKGGAPQQWSDKDILGEMSVVNGMKVSDLQERCDQRLGMSKATFYRYWNPMRKKGEKIRVDGEGLWYVLSSLRTNSETNETNETKSVSEPF